MTERTWLIEDGADHPATDDTAAAKALWTRRSALALTAGFFASGAAPARAAFLRWLVFLVSLVTET